VGSGTQAEQTAGIMIGYEKYLDTTYNPALCILVGDVTSTLACAIVAKKKQIKIAHVEAGIRSGDISMPEEINRIVTDSITDYFFTTTETANQNLINSGIKPEKIFFVGNVMIDTLKKNESKFYPPKIWDHLQLSPQNYFVLTLHRPSNVDNDKLFFNILSEIDHEAKEKHVVYPVHPRVKEKLLESKIKYKNIKLVEPMSYLEFNYLVKNSKGIITDSAGITEEATMYNVPCITLRGNTERPETVDLGTNVLEKNFQLDLEIIC
jgi:UDP-N-acetylglucosamine 2-epimerase (non-hydrolysing)